MLLGTLLLHFLQAAALLPAARPPWSTTLVCLLVLQPQAAADIRAAYSPQRQGDHYCNAHQHLRKVGTLNRPSRAGLSILLQNGVVHSQDACAPVISTVALDCYLGGLDAVWFATLLLCSTLFNVIAHASSALKTVIGVQVTAVPGMPDALVAMGLVASLPALQFGRTKEQQQVFLVAQWAASLGLKKHSDEMVHWRKSEAHSRRVQEAIGAHHKLWCVRCGLPDASGCVCVCALVTVSCPGLVVALQTDEPGRLLCSGTLALALSA
jgi:hypothetical protein